MQKASLPTIIPQKSFHLYPLLSRLLELHDVPKEIHIRGTLPNVTFDEYGRATPRILTIVGSRKNTAYGKHALENLIASLEGENIIIVSGLAYGIDALAHRNALNHSLVTLSVPGSGLSPLVIYPSTHKQLSEEIITAGGALLSELDDMTPASQWTFPQRNRIMAAMSDALLVIEAEEKSGTLITARLALELGRDIGAVPGDIFSPTSKGTNMLIHEGAYLISSPSDLFALLHISENKEDTSKKSSVEFIGNEKTLIDLLREPINKDALHIQSGLPFSEFITAFSTLEINGHITESLGEVKRLV